MRSYFLYVAMLFAVMLLHAPVPAQTWQRQQASLETRWAQQVSPANAWPEYPRPQLVRPSWTNLNGLWAYAITGKEAVPSVIADGSILVPYPIESALSGVKKSLQPDQVVWYQRHFFHEAGTKRTLLHFGAVDFEATVFINGKQVGSHSGGYTGFSFDITKALRPGDNEIKVKVWDPSDQGWGPHGKQVLHPESIYYTPSSGIWQTVWLENVPEAYIERLTITPDIDKATVHVMVHAASNASVTLHTAGKVIKGKANTDIVIPVANMHLWCVSDPFLYGLTVSLGKDTVTSYYGMRKVSIRKDNEGIDRIALNNQPYYNLGTLDQGFWPDGLYTAPTDEALQFDIRAIKAMGFNTIRKHIKIEPARWYYHCDKLGMLVWQDFVNPNQRLPEGSRAAFEKQGAEMLNQLHNYPSIITWVLFNEKWGQFDQDRLTSWVKHTDPSRLVNGHSGELLYVNDKLRSPSPHPYANADITDVHAYPDPMISLRQPGKAQVCGEFGGIGVFVPGHQWNTGAAWGYINETVATLQPKYFVMQQHLRLLAKEGLSGSIYTQPFDVEGEQNGLMTYDREVIKVPFAALREMHVALNPDAKTHIPQVTARDADRTEPAQLYANEVTAYMAGQQDRPHLKKLAMMALQVGDLAGRTRFGGQYIRSLHPPYAEEEWGLIDNMTSKVTDAGFPVLLEKAQSDRNAYVKAMNIIFADVLSFYVPQPDAKPDWTAAEKAVIAYGAPGEEIFLRAKVIHTMNQKDWLHFKEAAAMYLEKYGAHIAPDERAVFEREMKNEPGRQQDAN